MEGVKAEVELRPIRGRAEAEAEKRQRWSRGGGGTETARRWRWVQWGIHVSQENTKVI